MALIWPALLLWVWAGSALYYEAWIRNFYGNITVWPISPHILHFCQRLHMNEDDFTTNIKGSMGVTAALRLHFTLFTAHSPQEVNAWQRKMREITDQWRGNFQLWIPNSKCYLTTLPFRQRNTLHFGKNLCLYCVVFVSHVLYFQIIICSLCHLKNIVQHWKPVPIRLSKQIRPSVLKDKKFEHKRQVDSSFIRHPDADILTHQIRVGRLSNFLLLLHKKVVYIVLLLLW